MKPSSSITSHSRVPNSFDSFDRPSIFARSHWPVSPSEIHPRGAEKRNALDIPLPPVAFFRSIDSTHSCVFPKADRLYRLREYVRRRPKTNPRYQPCPGFSTARQVAAWRKLLLCQISVPTPNRTAPCGGTGISHAPLIASHHSIATPSYTDIY